MTPAKVKWVIAFAIGAGLLWLGWVVPVFLSTFHILLSIVLVLIILMQSGSAADLAGAFGGAGSQTAFGPRTAATFLTRATVWCATMFMLTSLTLSLHQTGGGPTINSVLSKSAAPKSQPAPAAPKPVVPVHLPPASPPTMPANPAKPPAKH
ncbi:MAG TPA: preprotein translocase subunit SecG [Candidatus Acidoferrales bacterium]|nr:preprotein translocase subunit SecG [Candidatus Acidoferrales bacterium]